jgi:hypothetical protein
MNLSDLRAGNGSDLQLVVVGRQNPTKLELRRALARIAA